MSALAAVIEEPRAVQYSRDEFRDIWRNADLSMDEASWLCPLRIDPFIVGESLAHLTTHSVRVFEVIGVDSGFYLKSGGERVVILNPEHMLDYDLVSDLSGTPDAHVYLWGTEAWEAGPEEDFELIQAWYRDETYPDTFKEDE